jgi:hypothetical protein
MNNDCKEQIKLVLILLGVQYMAVFARFITGA